MSINISTKISLALDNLKRLTDWIKHSDSKIALISVFQGALATFLINKTSDVIQIIKLNTFGWLQFILYFSIILFVFFLVKSIYQSFQALYPDIKTKEFSLFYFGSIAKQGKEKFNKDFKELDEEGTLNQLNSQIYVNSQIAFIKFENVQKSIKSLYSCTIFWFFSLVIIALLA